jgi:D-sedoheptulose 7-phosphate isomerase
VTPTPTPAEQARAALAGLAALASRVAEQHAADIARLAALYVDTLRGGGTLWFAGNGGSAADAQHVAAEYVVRYGRDRRALAAVALTTDTSLLTACGNDLGFEAIFARQVEALARPGDLLVLHSTSGESANLARAAQAARSKGVRVVALLGRGGGAVRRLVDDSLVIPADESSHIQELQLAVEHVICAIVEAQLAP